MRSNIGLMLVGLGIAAGTAACTIQEAESKTGTTGGTTTATGTGGAGQGGGAQGGAGQGGQAADACNGVPVMGKCSDDKTKISSCLVSEEPGQDPKIVETTCEPGTACEIWKGAAACRPTGECFEGDTQCKDVDTLQICAKGVWNDSACSGAKCVQSPGKGAACQQQDQGAGITIRGHLDYEVKKPNASLTDFETTGNEGAVDMFITVFEGAELIGMGLTSPGGNGMNPGDFAFEVTKQPTADSHIYFWPMLFDQTGNPRMAVAKAKSDAADYQQSDEYWSFGFDTCNPADCSGNDIDLGPLLIDDANDAGAVHIFQWLDYGIFRMEGLYPNATPLTVSVFWAKDNQFDCGSCFAPPQMGGANVLYDAAANLSDHYDSSLNISGSDKSPHHWSRTTINHEFGHWQMQSYSKSPGEGGPHYVDAPSRPGLAYSEGWATFVGQTNISVDNVNNEPIAFRKSQGTTFWVNLSDMKWSGGDIQAADPNGPLDQEINENLVSAMMWSLWAGANAQAPQNLGDAPLFAVMDDDRLLGSADRGYFTVDMVDWLDALKCGQQATADQISAAVAPTQFPYDNQEICQ
jgi:hypothetical protein